MMGYYKANSLSEKQNRFYLDVLYVTHKVHNLT